LYANPDIVRALLIAFQRTTDYRAHYAIACAMGRVLVGIGDNRLAQTTIQAMKEDNGRSINVAGFDFVVPGGLLKEARRVAEVYLTGEYVSGVEKPCHRDLHSGIEVTSLWQKILQTTNNFIIDGKTSREAYLDMFFGQTQKGQNLSDEEVTARAVAFKYQAYRKTNGDLEAAYDLNVFSNLIRAVRYDNRKINLLNFYFGIYIYPWDEFVEKIDTQGYDVLRNIEDLGTAISAKLLKRMVTNPVAGEPTREDRTTGGIDDREGLMRMEIQRDGSKIPMFKNVPVDIQNFAGFNFKIVSITRTKV